MMDELIAFKTYTQLVDLQRRANEFGYFWLAFADISLMFEHPDDFYGLIEAEWVITFNTKPRIHDDWRRHFPEYQYRLSDKARDVLKDPASHVQPIEMKWDDAIKKD